MKKVFLAVGLIFFAINVAQAHAFLDHADPRVGSTMRSSPPVLTLWFTEELERAFSKVRVMDAQGNEVDKKDAHVNPAKRTMMSVSLPALPPGTYKVVWSAVAVDTHHTTGTFSFNVAP